MRANNQFPFSFSNQPLTLSAFFSIPIFSGFNRQLQVEQAVTQRNDLDYQVRGLELQIDNTPVRTTDDVRNALEKVKGGEIVSLHLEDNQGRARVVNVRMPT